MRSGIKKYEAAQRISAILGREIPGLYRLSAAVTAALLAAIEDKLGGKTGDVGR